MRKLIPVFSLFFGLITVFIFFTLAQSALATSGACSGHGGVNCIAGSDWDGSVICNDGWTGSSVSYGSMVSCSGSSTSSYSTPSSYNKSIPENGILLKRELRMPCWE